MRLRADGGGKAFAVVAAALLCASDASADTSVYFGLGTSVAYMRETPTLATDDAVETAARSIPQNSRFKMTGATTSVGGYVDGGLVLSDRFLFPMIGFAAYGAVGPYDAVGGSLDGSIASARPWTMFRGDFLLPGVGWRAKHRRNVLEVDLRTGVSFVQVRGSVAGAGDTTEVTLSAVSFLVEAGIKGCRRLDPVTRVCLEVMPRVYDFGFATGAVAGLRVEWGM